MDPIQAIIDYIEADDVADALVIEQQLRHWYQNGGFRPHDWEVLNEMDQNQSGSVFVQDTVKRLVALT